MPQEVARINVIRHAPTRWNRDKCVQSDTDIPLDLQGWGWARSYAHALRSEKIDLIFSSPLIRAAQTAMAIASDRNLQVIILEGLKERSFGALEGGNYEDSRQARHDFLVNQSNNPYGIETDKQLDQRILPLVRHIAQAYSGLHTLVVGHSSEMRYMLKALGGRTYENMYDMPIDNGSMIKIFGDRQGIVASPNPISLNY